MTEEASLNIWTTIYFTCLVIAAIAGAFSIVAGVIQYKISNQVTKRMQNEALVLQANLENEKEKLAQTQIEVAEAKRKQAEAEINLSKVSTTLINVNNEVESIGLELSSMPKIYTGSDEPKNPQKGDLWFPPK